MADKEDYLTSYREFFEHFAKTVNPHDQLPVKLGSYKLLNTEVIGGIIDWTTQYLSQKHCPDHLFSPLIKVVIEEIRKACKKDPLSYGFNANDNAYEPLKLMQAVMAKTNEVCLRYLDNSLLYSLPAPASTYYMTSISAKRNKRRTMEDRHVAIHDLNLMFNSQEASPSSYYAIFDGHAGHDAAVYSAAHLHQYLAENKYFINKPVQALQDAFCKTDACFLEKCRVENFTGGTTAVVALLRPKEKFLYIAWVGDSQALLVKQGQILQCVDPHTPSKEEERARIEREGGSVLFYGTWRVNGQLAVSRAIGDASYKPYVTAIPDVIDVSLDGGEDFLILACDGLWDHLNEESAAQAVYDFIAKRPDDIKRISDHLVQLACSTGSQDNISVIVVFLRDLHQIATEAQRWSSKNGSRLTSSNMETGLDNVNNPFTNSNSSLKNLDTDNINLQNNDGLLLNLTDNLKANGADFNQDIFVNEKANGTKKSTTELHFGDDFGPETNVDAVDDTFSPIDKEKSFVHDYVDEVKGLQDVNSIARNLEKSFTEEVANNNPLDDGFNPFLNRDQLEEHSANEILALSREETPTPPADPVHDAGGLDVNPTESDSEDEWNYIKGAQEKPEKLLIVESSEEDDAMSRLNPNAAEFIPISPTRNIQSPPVCRPVLEDQVISQSPKRPAQFEVKIPSETEFEDEVKSRPSDVNENGHGSEDENNRTSGGGEMHDILSALSPDKISDFQPSSTPLKVPAEEFHFGPNAAPFTPRANLDQSEAISTKADFGDDTVNTFNVSESFNDYDLAFASKEEANSMSESFYAEKGDPNPFLDENDLNKVHQLPENVDDFIGDLVESTKENLIFNGTGTNLSFVLDTPVEHEIAGTDIQTTDLDILVENNENGISNLDREQQSSLTPLDRPLVDLTRLDEPILDTLELRVTESETSNVQGVDLSQVEAEHPLGLTQDDKQEEKLTSSIQDDLLSVEELSPAKSQSSLVDISSKEDASSDSFEANAPEEGIAETETTLPEVHSPIIEASAFEDTEKVLLNNQIPQLQETPMVSTSELEAPREKTAELEVPTLQPEISTVPIPEPEEPTLQPEVFSAPIPEPEEFSLQPEVSSVPTPEPEESSLRIGEPEAKLELPTLPSPEPEVPSEPITEIEEPRVPVSEPEVPILPILKPEEPSLPNEPEVKPEQIPAPEPEVSEPEEIASLRLSQLETPIVTVSDVQIPDQEAVASDAEVLPTLQTPEPEVGSAQIVEELPTVTAPEIVAAREPEVLKESVIEQSADVLVAPQSSDKPSAATKKPIGKVESKKSATKPLSKPTTGSPRAGLAAKAPAKTGASSRPEGVARAALTAAPAPKPKTAANTKPSPRKIISRPAGEGPSTKTLSRPATAPSKTSPSLPKTNATNPLTRPTAAPRTIPPRPATLSRAPPKTAPVSKPKLVPAAGRTATTTSATRTNTASKTTVAPKTALPSKTATAPSKPRTITSVPSKPRVPLTKTVPKSADLEKAKKDSANKLTASHSTTATRTCSNSVTSTSVNKLEVKTTTNRTTTVTKKPGDHEITSKTTKITRTQRPKENGVASTIALSENNVIP